MKTKEQASYDALKESPSYVINAASVFHEGFARGVEFAQRWIPVDEEFPVFDKAKYPNGDYEQYFVKISTGGMSPTTIYAVSHLTNNTKWSCEFDWNMVTHWRPIEYK